MGKITETVSNPLKAEKEEERPRRQLLPPEKCPRCESMNTKFCYYNNYSLAQPRYFCKTCRRYWTKGGALRNVPFGGSCRRGKRLQASSSYQPLSMPQHDMQSHLVLGRSMPIAAMISGSDQGVIPQASVAYDTFRAIGGGYYGTPASDQEQVVPPSMFAKAMFGTYGGSGSESEALVGSSSRSGVLRDEHGRLSTGIDGLSGTGGRYPSVLPSPYIDKNLYFVKDI